MFEPEMCEHRVGDHTQKRRSETTVDLTATQEFAASRGINKAYGTYSELAADPEVRGHYII